MTYSYCGFVVPTPGCQSYMVFQRTCHFIIIMLLFSQALICFFFPLTSDTSPHFWGNREGRESERRKRGGGQTHADHQGTAAGFHVLCWTAQMELEGKLFEK